MDVTDFEVTGSLLLDLLVNDETQSGLCTLVGLVEKWTHEYDHAETVHTEDGCNTMHLVGMSLSVLMF
jgi:hypothetical protein